jgi:hypothetical protein
MGEHPVITTALQQVPKVLDPLAQANEPGLGQDLKPRAKKPPGMPGATDKPGVTQTGAEMGFSARGLSGRGLATTPATLDRSSFTRSGEKKSIQGQRSTSESEIRASAVPRTRNVWSAAARAKALATRRANALKRREQQEPLPAPETKPEPGGDES